MCLVLHAPDAHMAPTPRCQMRVERPTPSLSGGLSLRRWASNLFRSHRAYQAFVNWDPTGSKPHRTRLTRVICGPGIQILNYLTIRSARPASVLDSHPGHPRSEKDSKLTANAGRAKRFRRCLLARRALALAARAEELGLSRSRMRAPSLGPSLNAPAL